MTEPAKVLAHLREVAEEAAVHGEEYEQLPAGWFRSIRPDTVLKLLAVVEAARLAACLPRTQRTSSVLAALDAALAALTEPDKS